MTEDEKPRLIITFRKAYDPAAQEVKKSLDELGVLYSSDPIKVMHYSGRGDDPHHFNDRFVIPDATSIDVWSFLVWAAGKGKAMFLSVEWKVTKGNREYFSKGATLEEFGKMMKMADELDAAENKSAEPMPDIPKAKKKKRKKD